MTNKIEKVAVLGAGIMGSQIAAHLANVGVPSLLFDINQEAAEAGLQAATKVKPAAFYSPRYAERITPCNYEDHLERLKEANWVIEVIVERLDIKQNLFQKILPYLRPDAIISSNTSGLAIKDMMADMPESLKQRFLVTHFFNPPRYMHLLEIVPGEATRPEIVQSAVQVGENFLGKGIVYAKDTPNFVANRIGVFGMMLALKLTQDMHLTVEEVDKLTGPVIGHAKSATFRTADLVGLDTLAHVSQTAFDKCPDDEAKDLFRIPGFLKKMIENKMLGSKTKKGFYQKVGKDILSLDFNKFDYSPQKRVRMDGLRIAKRQHTTAGKISVLINSDDKAGKFSWELLANTLIYSANRIPEIAEDIVNVDNAMKWGFGWELGPFETWDALGVEKIVRRMESERKKVPKWVKEMIASGHHSFYGQKNSSVTYFDIPGQSEKILEENPRIVRLNVLKKVGKEIRKNWNSSLIDLGDGVGLVEFHSIIHPQMNPLDGAILDMISDALTDLPASGFKALVIGHQGPQFSVGANLALIQKYCEEQNWEMLEQLSKTFQDTTQQVRFAPIPVVAAPFSMCLGGGFEIIGACDRRVASAELYCGLVEAGVGLIPGAGGNLRLLMNNMKTMSRGRPGPFPVVQKTFETIGFAKVSRSAKEAVSLGYLTRDDKIVVNPDHLIHEAKQEAIKIAEGYQPPELEKSLYLPGEGGRLAMEDALNNYVKGGKISRHDALIGKKLAYVLTGGDRGSPFQPVDEQYLLDIEREAFVSLCAEPKTQARIAYMLKTGKPLRN